MSARIRTGLGGRVRARRLALGLTQREVAGKDLTRGFVSQIENGMIDPSLRSLEVLARRLRTSVAALLEPDEPSGSPPDQLPAEQLAEARSLAAQGNPHRARRCLEAALRALDQRKDRPVALVIEILVELGTVLREEGEDDAAVKSLQRAIVLARQSRHAYKFGEALEALAASLARLGSMSEAIDTYRRATLYYEAWEETADAARVRTTMARLHIGRREYGVATSLLRTAAVDLQRAGRPVAAGRAYVFLAEIGLATKRHGLAAEACRQALLNLPAGRARARALILWARLLTSEERLTEAKEACAEAIDIFEQHGNADRLAEAFQCMRDIERRNIRYASGHSHVH